MRNNKFESSITISFIWKFFERTSYQVIYLAVHIIMARLLSPDKFGTIAIVMVFINLIIVVFQSGLNISLLQQKSVTDIDYSSVFIVNIIIAFVTYSILFLISPIIAYIYDNLEMINFIRVLGILIFINAIFSIQSSYTIRNNKFKQLFYINLTSCIVSGFIGIYSALLKFEEWAIIFQQVSYSLCNMILMFIYIKWRPRKAFSLERVIIFFRYGWKISVSSILTILYTDLRSLIIGYKYSSEQLGYYNRGQQLPQVFSSNLNETIQAVIMPQMAKYQDDYSIIKNIMKKTIIISSFFVFPLMAGMCILAKPLVLILLTNKWLPIVSFLQIFCLTYIFIPLNSANIQAIKAIGRSDVFLKLEIIKKILGLIILIISLFFGIYGIAIGQLVSNVLYTLINFYPISKIFDYKFSDQIKDVLPNLILTFFMSIVVIIVGSLNINQYILFILQIIVGMFVYFSVAIIINIPSVRIFKSIINH